MKEDATDVADSTIHKSALLRDIGEPCGNRMLNESELRVSVTKRMIDQRHS